MTEIEEWTDIAGFDKYECTKHGEVRNKKTKKVLKPYPNYVGGYDVVDLSCPEKRRCQRTVHRLIAETFLPKREGANIVDHLNGCRTDNRAENLRWTTSYGNALNRQNCRYFSWNKTLQRFSCYWSIGNGLKLKGLRKTEQEAILWVAAARQTYPHQY